MIICFTCKGPKKSKNGKNCRSCGQNLRHRIIYPETTYSCKDYLNRKREKKFLKQQNFKCAICLINLTKVRKCLDHNHKTKIIRGVLCDNCNKGLGHFKDESINLLRAYNYLKDN